MLKLSVNELREKYIQFFVSKGHALIPSSSLIPENDPSALFTTAGMHPLAPYLLGEKHPAGTRLTNVQKCLRTGDIDRVGDDSHCTFFEMLGNWSLGDYFKEESIKYSYEFLTRELKIPSEKIAVSCFEGDSDIPKDEESAKIWRKLGIKEENIYFLSKEHNWWGPVGQTGPCGPDTEIFIIDDNKEPCGPNCSPACDCGRFLEIWNNVFMEYNKQADGGYVPLSQKNVDTGMGLERTAAILNGYKSVYQTEAFAPVMRLMDQKTKKGAFIKEKRIVADHMRAAAFILGDENGVSPSNVDQGYVLRRLIRRAIRYCRTMDLDTSALIDISNLYVDFYGGYYKELIQNRQRIIEELSAETERFNKTIAQGLKEFEKLLKYIQNNRISGKAAFRLYDTFGFPIEMTTELAADHGITVDIEGFKAAFEEHQRKSQKGAEQKFKGGLADNTEQTARLHTATHLLLAALKRALNDDNIRQRGSNITAERLRFDFNFPRPLTKEEIEKVEKLVNEAIEAGVDIECNEMSLADARDMGAEGVFGDKYSDQVKVYKIGDYSLEICGGPHAKNTKELKNFKIVKEQSSSAGVRRIKAVIDTD